MCCRGNWKPRIRAQTRAFLSCYDACAPTHGSHCCPKKCGLQHWGSGLIKVTDSQAETVFEL